MMNKVPQILRARGYRLYTNNGRRLIDLWLNGGRALLGHTPPNVLRELKNTASRGLYAPYPHFTEARLLKALSKLLPEYSFRLYNAVPLCSLRSFRSQNVRCVRYFPFTIPTESLLELVLPTPLSINIIAAKNDSDLPPSETLPPLTLAVATRAIHDLIASPERTRPHLPRTFKAFKADTCPWQRDSIYLTLKEDTISEEKWQVLFCKFLEAGFLLPPTPEDPLILPGELSDGEDAKLAKALQES